MKKIAGVVLIVILIIGLTWVLVYLSDWKTALVSYVITAGIVGVVWLIIYLLTDD